ncbi:hypothetical protein [Microbulbifer pacificus]|uniref:CopL family metal-binding regulatory protein n=1 Tax=Microbulbifer pacificus TaxID=407164 RepID=A0AAU0N337_9GAMM|nr:hypothetical protein [Microbulbifer pacificus]WOX06903.1 hypothetical protein R5R33_07150 [Microbulbifer pacificus]
MQKFIARFMAIILLLSVFGQVAAQPCADMHAPAAMNMAAEPLAAEPHHGHTAEHASAGSAPMPANHCGDMASPQKAKADAHCADMSTSTSDDCGQACTCCPSHCATVLPPAESTGIALPRTTHPMTYTALASSAEPESAIKPPRSA